MGKSILRPGMQHIVVSRFNVRMRGFQPRTEEWVRKRLELFRSYAVRSMRSQTSTCDSWLIFCDAGSRSWFEGPLSDALSEVPQAEPIWTDQAFWDCARDEITARVRPGEKLITTRIDTDDAISRGYLGAVQAAASEMRFGALNFLHGAQLVGTRVYRRSDPSNMFISFVEQASERPLTVFVDEHHVLEHHGPLVQVRTSPLWLQVIHEENIISSVRGIRTSASRVLRDFDLGLTPRETHAEVTLDRVRTSVRMAIRVVSAPHRLRWALRVLLARGRSKGR